LNDIAIVHQPFTRTQLTEHIRRRLGDSIYDESAVAGAIAIYTLADPRDLRRVRYVGQTRAPQRRFLQHIAIARLWLPDNAPWRFRPAPQRPLYDWIRELHRDEHRLPVMVISEWVATARDARQQERASIHRCLHELLPLLNVEAEMLQRQIPLAL
jgi:hypothetical protein